MAAFMFLLSAASFTDPGHSVKGPLVPFHEFQRQISDLLKREAQAKTSAARAPVIRALCDLHSQIVHDERYTTSDVLKEYRARLWSRLNKVKAEIKQDLARDARGNRERLADIAALEAADPAAVAASESLATSLAFLDQTQIGPSLAGAFGGGALPADFGQDLVALIERTINPGFWDVVGGPGTVYYYAPLQCLVVRATTEIHEDIGGVVGELRGARP